MPLIFVLVFSLLAGGLATRSEAQIRLIPAPAVGVQRAPEHLAVADIDGDGTGEILVVSPASNMLAVLSVTGAGGVTPRRNITLGRNLIGIATVDVDGDGRVDVLLADSSGGARNGDLLLLRGTGSIDLAAPEAFALPVFALRSFASGDFDGDGFPDAVIVTGARRQIALLRNHDSGASFETQPLITGFERDPRKVRAARLDASGRDSLIVLNTSPNRDDELVVLQVEGETFTVPGLSLGMSSTAVVDFVTGDFNGNGYTDIAVLHATADRAFFITTMLSRPEFANDGATTPGSFDIRAPAAFDCPTDSGGSFTRCNVVALAAGDFDDDGIDDLAIATDRPAELKILAGLGDGTFDVAERIVLSNAQRISALTAGDVTGDGVDDLIVADSGNNTLTLLRADAPPRAPLGTSCLRPNDCVSGACVHGVCCASPMCFGSERCDVPDSEGSCAPPAPLGTRCHSAATCASGFCTDGVCCSSAFCFPGESCGSSFAPGECVPAPATPTPTPTLAPGVTPTPLPVGRDCISGFQCMSGLCVDRTCCADICSAGTFCDLSDNRGSCAPRRFVGQPCGLDSDCVTGACGASSLCVLAATPTPTPVRAPLGVACGDADECQSRHCADAVCCSEATCALGESCAVSGSEGDCRPLAAPGSPCVRDGDCRDGGPCVGDDGNRRCSQAPATPVPSACVGDCSGDGQVTVDEILVLIEIALGTRSLASCASGDMNGDGQVSVDEVLIAVGLALTGCPTSQSP